MNIACHGGSLALVMWSSGGGGGNLLLEPDGRSWWKLAYIFRCSHGSTRAENGTQLLMKLGGRGGIDKRAMQVLFICSAEPDGRPFSSEMRPSCQRLPPGVRIAQLVACLKLKSETE